MKVVVALGGNALGNTPEEQKELVKNTSESIADLIEQKHEVVVVHGNGPQVGMIQGAFEEASQGNGKFPLMPLPECGSMSQGYIGYHLQNGIKNALLKRNIYRDVATVVTQTVVDGADKAFENPTKPIGSFMSKEEAEALQKKTGLPIVEDSGRGYRFVVASPKPVDIVEKNSIRNLLDNETVVVACGGGGIPVIHKDDGYEGVPAVIDKDSSSATLAQLLGADMFVILTAVERVAINFGKSNQKDLDKMSTSAAKEYIEEGQFAPGSMLPKVEAAIDFVSGKEDARAVIAALEDAASAIKGEKGTVVYYE